MRMVDTVPVNPFFKIGKPRLSTVLDHDQGEVFAEMQSNR